MLKSLAIKELRESVGVVAVGLLAAAYVLAQLTGKQPVPLFNNWLTAGFPFVLDQFDLSFVLVIGALAIALGLKQSAVETGRGTYYFLLHQPASRQFVFGTKLAVGAGFVLTVGGLLLLMYAFWAATPGHVAAPFDWSMTKHAWQLWLCMPLLYLGAFLSGIRPARWFGTRLMPLATAGVMAFLAAMLPWWWLTAVAVALSAALIIVSVFYYADYRDY